MILVCGEALIDLAFDPAARGGTSRADRAVPFLAHPGGSPANTAVALARLGSQVTFCGRLSEDGLGRILRAHLADNDVGLDLCVAAPEPASLAVVTVTDDGHADYSFYVNGTADWQWRPAELPDPLPAEVRAIHTGSLALALPPGAAVLEGLLHRERGRRVISIDPNVRPALVGDRADYRRRLEAWLAVADLVKISSDDLAWVYPGQPAAQVAERWLRSGPAVVVVTAGAAGSLALAGDVRVSVPAERVDVADTVGAGDSFTAGFVHWLERHDLLSPVALRALTSEQLGAAIAFAGRVAAITCSRPGAQPPYAAELDER